MNVHARYRAGDRLRRILGLALLAATIATLLTACASDSTTTSASTRATNHAGAQATATPSTSTSTSTPPAVTTVHTFTPYRAGTLAVRVIGRARGSCFTGSAAAPVAGAYRCFAGNALLDPCFAVRRTSTTVACLDSPWSAATVLTLTKPLPVVTPFGDGSRAWALQLDDGTRCVASTGTVPSIGGVNLPYRCAAGGAATVVDPHAARVLARFASRGATTLQGRTVAVLWRG